MSSQPESKIYSELEQISPSDVQVFEEKLGGVVGYKFEAIDPLRLTDETIRLRVCNLPSAVVFSLNLPNRLVLGEDFVTLLSASRPRDKGKSFRDRQNIKGVLNDWRMPDFPDGFGEKERLLLLHQKLGPLWDEYVTGDRLKFIAALQADRGFTDMVQFRMGQLTNRFISTKDEERIRQEAYSALTKQQFELYVSAAIRLAKPFIELPVEMQIGLENREIQERLSHKVVVPESGPVNFISNDYSLRQAVGDLVAERIGRQFVITWGPFEGSFSADSQNYRTMDFKPFDPQEKALIPWLVWGVDKTSGQRFLLDGQLPEWISEDIDARANRRLGLIIAASFSPRQRDKMPQKHGLDKGGGGYQQPMREAQMPLLVAMCKGALTKGEFFEEVEEFAGIPDLSYAGRLRRELRLFKEQALDKILPLGTRAGKMLIGPGFNIIVGGIITSYGLWGLTQLGFDHSSIRSEVDDRYPLAVKHPKIPIPDDIGAVVNGLKDARDRMGIEDEQVLKYFNEPIETLEAHRLFNDLHTQRASKNPHMEGWIALPGAIILLIGVGRKLEY